jgi:hypothetical protein
MKGNHGRSLPRIAALLLITALAAGAAPGAPSIAAAQATEPPEIVAELPSGVSLELWAWGEFTAEIPDQTALVLDRVSLRGCAVAQAEGLSGPVLLFAESYSVTVNIAVDGNLETRSLAQGESLMLDPGADPIAGYELMNGMGDPAYHVSVLRLHFAPLGEPATVASDEPSRAPWAPWPDGSLCGGQSVAAGQPPTVERLAEGVDGEGATILYLGAGTWQGCAGLPAAPSGQASAINVLVLTGGMFGGMSSGRGTFEGPGDLLRDAYAEQIGHIPFTNDGSVPAHTLIFGTAAPGEPVLVPNPIADQMPQPCRSRPG